MKPLFASLRLHEIHHLKNLLEAAGIRSSIRNEQLCMLAGEVPFTECAAQIVLACEADRPAALEVLRQWREPPAAGAPWQCAVCGEHLDGQFTACWRCSAPR